LLKRTLFLVLAVVAAGLAQAQPFKWTVSITADSLGIAATDDDFGYGVAWRG
jgi:hypothetical protein